MAAALPFISNYAAYPTPQRTVPNSVQRTLRRIELTEKVCGVPYAAHFFPCGNFGAITPPALRALRLMVFLPRSGCTFFHCALTIPHNNRGQKCITHSYPLTLNEFLYTFGIIAGERWLPLGLLERFEL